MENASRYLIDLYLLEAIYFNYDEKNYDLLKNRLSIYPEIMLDLYI